MYESDRVLIVDAGNSRVKYTVYSQDDALYHGADLAAALATGLCMQAVYFASVRSEHDSQQLIQQIKEHVSVCPWYILTSQATACGIQNAYDEPHRLGVDRWLTVIAAYHYTAKATVIVDAGTAIKVDLVDANGVHLGGYITPGLSLMESALLQNTAKVRYQPSEVVEGDNLPNSTARAVAEGCREMALGFLDRVHQSYKNYTWLATGGDAEALLQALGIDAELRPYLVAEGAKILGDEMVRELQ
ncbi:type III pantothenate kinase [Marinomonas epiphytica]